MTKKIYTREEAAELLEISLSTLKIETGRCQVPDEYELGGGNGKGRRTRRIYRLEWLKTIAKSRRGRGLTAPKTLLR